MRSLLALTSLALLGGLAACSSDSMDSRSRQASNDFQAQCIRTQPGTAAAVADCRQRAASLGIQWTPPVIAAAPMSSTTTTTTTTTTAPVSGPAAGGLAMGQQGTPWDNALVFPALPAGASGAAAQAYANRCLGAPVVALDRQQSCSDLYRMAQSEMIGAQTATAPDTGSSGGFVFRR